MNLTTLDAALRAAGIQQRYLAIGTVGPGAWDKHCIVHRSGVWEVYYTERGEKASLQTFATEADACDYFYNWVMSLPYLK